MALGWLSDEECSVLVRPISPDEVRIIIQSFSNGKIPGPDGLPAEFYKANGDLLAPLLASLYE